MKKILCTLCLVLSTTLSFADSPKVIESTAKACKGSALSKSIEFFVAADTASKSFVNEQSWSGKKLFLEKTPSLTYKDIDHLNVPSTDAGQKSFTLFFNTDGTNKVSILAKKNMNNYLVIMVDGQIGLSAAIKSELGTEVMITDSIQTDGKSLFSKMCPSPNVFVTRTPKVQPIEEKPATDDKTKPADPTATQTPAASPVPAK